METFDNYLTRQRAEYGDRFDPSSLAPQFIPYLNSGQRIKVRSTYGGDEVYERTGTVGVTGGWRPAFLLMHRSSDIGSSDVLGRKDEIVAVQRGRKYEETK